MDYPQDASVGLVDGKFVDENETTAQVGSLIPASWGNAVTDEIIGVLTAAGLEADEADVTQLIKAIRILMQMSAVNYAVDSSAAANAIVLALTPAVTAYTDGAVVRFKAANANTGAVTINWGAGAISLVSAAGALEGGEIVAGRQYACIYSATLNQAILVAKAAGPVPVPAATKSSHAVNLAQFAASLTSSGYQKLPNGFIIQWGTVSVASASGTAFTFAIAFPNSCLCVACADTGSSGFSYGVTPSKTGGTVYARQGATQIAAAAGFWIALGF